MEDRTMQIRHILAPTDFSEPSKQAIAYAFELAQTFGATLVLLHVIEELPPYISSNATAMNPGITATHMTVLIVTINTGSRL